MDASIFFIQIVIILVTARFLGELASRFAIPAVLGELFAGILLGPTILNWIQPSETITLLAEIGIVLLLFEIGLQADITKLVKVGTQATFSAFAGVVGPFILGFYVSYELFNLTLLTSLFIGGTLTATSTGVTLRVLADFKRQGSRENQIILGAAILDDIIGIIILSLLYEFSIKETVDFFSMGKVVLLIVIFLIAAPILAKIVSSLIKKYDDYSTIPGLVTTSIISLILLFAWLADKFGAPELIGGFAAGLALSRKFLIPLPKKLQTNDHFFIKIENKLSPIIYLFVPIFFVNIGLELNLREIAWGSNFVLFFSGMLFLAAILGKLAAGFILLKESRFIKWAVGLAMIPRGELGLIFAQFGKMSGLFDSQIYATIIIVIAFTTFFTPFVMREFYRHHDKKGTNM